MSAAQKKPTSKVKILILGMLEAGHWVSSEKLLQKTGQKYFDRRIRELRDEFGYDIETKHINGDYSYRLRSDTRLPSKPRTYLSPKEKKNIFALWDKKCSLCGKGMSNEKPSYDHKVPLIRGEGGKIGNFQIVCTACNNRKRAQCRGCELDCQSCFLAFPERVPKNFVLHIKDSKIISEIKKLAEAEEVPVEEWINKTLRKFLKK